jgi:two-component system response regulator YesN
MDSSLSLKAVADAVELSSVYFCRLFYAQTGVHFSEYLSETRISKAKELLRSGFNKVYEIADMTGFHDAKHFSAKFKKMVGVTPLEYRNK